MNGCRRCRAARLCDGVRRGHAGEWESRWREAAREDGRRPRPADGKHEPPYRGLARFEPARRGTCSSAATRSWRNWPTPSATHRLVAVVGASGSGKSSLLRAGLIPALRTGQAPDRRPAAVRILTPGARPGRRRTPSASRPSATTATATPGDRRPVRGGLHPLRRPRRAGAFLDLPAHRPAPSSRLRVVIAVRARLLRPLRRPPRPGRGAAARHPAGRPDEPRELREAVVRPATAAGLIVERTLTARIVDEVADGARRAAADVARPAGDLAPPPRPGADRGDVRGGRRPARRHRRAPPSRSTASSAPGRPQRPPRSCCGWSIPATASPTPGARFAGRNRASARPTATAACWSS